MFDSERCDDMFRELCPDIYVKGRDYPLDTINAQEREVLESVNADIRFLPFVEGLSTTQIIGCVVFVLKLPIRPGFSGIFKLIKPFPGTYMLTGAPLLGVIAEAASASNAKNIMDRPLVELQNVRNP